MIGMNFQEPIIVIVVLIFFFMLMWCYVRHRIWQRKNLAESSRSPFETRSHFPMSHYQSPYLIPAPNSRRSRRPTYFGSHDINQSSRSNRTPPPIMIFTVSIPEENEEDLPPSYEEVIKSRPVAVICES